MIKKLESAPAGWDFLFLGVNPHHCPPSQRACSIPPLGGDGGCQGRFQRPKGSCQVGFYAYAISLSGAGKGLELMRPMSSPVDTQMSPHFNSGKGEVKAYLAYPTFVSHNFDIPSDRVTIDSARWEENIGPKEGGTL